jgi:hypothetical protein
MMVDCWRRLYFYWKSRRNWKSVAWHYTYEWHAHKMKGAYISIRGMLCERFRAVIAVCVGFGGLLRCQLLILCAVVFLDAPQ